MPGIKEAETIASNIGRSVLLLILPHYAECTRSSLLAPRENRGHVVRLCFVIASSIKHGDIMRRTFVSRSRRHDPLGISSGALSTLLAGCIYPPTQVHA